MKNKFIILFAGPIGSSKSPIANYLSCKLKLPVFNSDIINTEVIEDLLENDNEEFEHRRQSRMLEILDSGTSFILDLSIDRKADNLLYDLEQRNYMAFIISLDLSKDFLEKLYKAKGYTESLSKIDINYSEHQIFLDKHLNKVNLSIKDADFLNRLELCLETSNQWINS